MEHNDISILIINRKVGIMELALMDGAQVAINELMYGVDVVRHRLDIKWGVGRVVDLASADMRAKWDRQMEKLNDAIIEKDVVAVEELVKGCVRGYAAMERAAIEGGHVPYPVEVKAFECGGTKYGVVDTIADLGCVVSPPAGLEMISIEELLRVYHVRHQNELMARPGDEFKGEFVAQDRPFEDKDLGF